MRGSLRLLVLLITVAVSAIGAVPASAGLYNLDNGTLIISVGSGETVTMRAVPGGVEFTAAGWLNDGFPGGSGWTLSGSNPETLTVSSSAVDANNVHLSAFRIEDMMGDANVQVLGSGTAWPFPVVINLDGALSTVSFQATDPVSPITFGSNAVTATASAVTVADEISSAGSISLTGTASAPLIRADMTVPAPGTITLNGARVRTVGTTALTAGTVVVNGPVVGVASCAGVEISYCSVAPGSLEIHGNVVATSAWSDLVRLQVTGTARLGGDVTTSSSQDWQGPVYVTALGTLTLTGSTIATPQGVAPYAGPCGGVIVTCDVGSQSPSATFSDLVVDGNWLVGGSVTPVDGIRATGLTSVSGTGMNSTFAPTTAGAQEYAGGLSIVIPRAATMSASSVTIAGMPEQQGVGSVAAATCDTGPLTVTGALRITAAVDCLDSLSVIGPMTIAADVATQRYQSYHGAVTLSLGSRSLRLRAGAGHNVAFHGTPVAAEWSRAAGDDITGYTATISPTGQACSTTGALTCAFGDVPAGSDLTFSVAPLRPAPASGSTTASRGTTAQTVVAFRRTVGRESRTSLLRLIAPPAVRGTQTWAEHGPCRIRGRQLLTPSRAATCTLILRIRRGAAVVWTGRATIRVR